MTSPALLLLRANLLDLTYAYDPVGTNKWYKNGRLHRDDGPAVLCKNGDKKWYRNGKLHREHAPAIRKGDGSQEWYRNGKLHRANGPAKIDDYGREVVYKGWYNHGKLHRLDGPAQTSPFDEHWYFNGKLHRVNGPAVNDYDGYEIWYNNGKKHREDGPAFICRSHNAWYLNGELYLIDGDHKISVEIEVHDCSVKVNLLDWQGVSSHYFNFIDHESAILWYFKHGYSSIRLPNFSLDY